MPVYFIASYDITDSLRYENDYVPGVVRTLAAAGGEVVVATGSTRTVEGTAPRQTVVLRFPSDQAFDDWYGSREYAPLLEIRLATTANGSAVLANEFTPGAARRRSTAARPRRRGRQADGGRS